MRKKGFTLVESMVVIAIIVIILSTVFININNKKRVVLRNDAEKIFKFLKNVQAIATKNSPVITTNQFNGTFNTNIFNNLQPNRFFEARTFRLSFINDDNIIDLRNFQIIDNLSFSEIDRNIIISVDDNINNLNVNCFGDQQQGFNPVSLVAIILTNNNRIAIPFRTNGVIALNPTNLGTDRTLRLSLSMRNLNRRHVIMLPGESARIEIYSQ